MELEGEESRISGIISKQLPTMVMYSALLYLHTGTVVTLFIYVCGHNKNIKEKIKSYVRIFYVDEYEVL